MDNLNTQNLPTALNAKAVAQSLGISRAGAYNLMRSKDFPSMRVGGRIMIMSDAFERWLEKLANDTSWKEA